jgi:ribonuclease J
MIGDSTNAVREGRSPSETDVAKTLAELIASAPARVAITTFASNIARIRAAALAAKACDREVVVVGRAMDRLVQVARETGYLDDVQAFRPADAYGYLPPDKVIAICTGSQGEPRAALSRIAQDDHPEVTLSRGDRVIFSSRAIPGNERAIGRVINGLIGQGVEVITDRTHLVHVSGHPRVAEVEDMYRWVRPQAAVPVHGEALHLFEHGKIARRSGVKNIVECHNGDVIRLAPAPAGKVDEVRNGRLYKDGRLIIEASAPTVNERRKLAAVGVVVVSIAVDESGEMVADPEVELIGIPERNASGESLEDIVYNAVVDTAENLPRARRRDPDAVSESVRRAVRGLVAQEWGKKPVCTVHVLKT